MKLIDKFSIYNLLSFFLYLTLIIGFLFGENLNFGSYYDWVNAYNVPIKDFSENLIKTLLNYDQYGQRLSLIHI